MSTIQRIVCLWEGGGGMPGTNTLYADDGQSDEDFRAACSDFYNEYAGLVLSDDFQVTVPATGPTIDSTTGHLNGTWSSGSDEVISGTDTANRVPDVSQILLQLRTGFIVQGRELRGRLFLPGCRVTATTGGNVDPAAAGAIADAANDAFVGTMSVYSVTHHTFAAVSEVQCWTEFASLRSRRD